MKTSKVTVSRDFTVDRTDDRLFGSFVEHMGATVYHGIYDPGSPLSDENGFRLDVLELVRELKLSMIRYPGGNFTSGFAWEDSVGPVENRPRRLDLAWKAIDPNTFGLNEFMKWLALAGSDPIMTVNLGTRGIDAARDLVEYCNFAGGSRWSDLRRSHGVEAPHGIKTWCLGNELDGPWQIAAKTADEYGRVACEAGKVMKWVDPDIELVAVGSSHSRMDSFPKWDRKVLMRTYDVADYLSLHHYIDRTALYSPISSVTGIDPKEAKIFLGTQEYLARTIHVDRQIHDVIATCDHVQSVRRSSRRMNLAFDEWNVIAAKKHADSDFQEWETGSPIDCGAHSMEDALAFASMMMSIVRRADRIKIACQSLLVNTGPLIIAKAGAPAWRNAIFYPFLHVSRYGRGMVLQTVVETPTYGTEEFESVPYLDLMAVHDEEGGHLTFFAVNRSPEAMPVELDIRDFGSVVMEEHIEMRHDDLDAANTMDCPDRVVPGHSNDTRVERGRVVGTLAGHSWNVVRLKLNG